MTDWIQAWQCIGCGKIEAPQPCIGVCRDRKILMVGKDDHERALAEGVVLRAQLARARAMLQRFSLATPQVNLVTSTASTNKSDILLAASGSVTRAWSVDRDRKSVV